MGWQNKIHQAARRHRRFRQVPVLGASEIETDSKTCFLLQHSGRSQRDQVGKAGVDLYALYFYLLIYSFIFEQFT